MISKFNYQFNVNILVYFSSFETLFLSSNQFQIVFFSQSDQIIHPLLKPISYLHVDGARCHQHTRHVRNVKSQLYFTPFQVGSTSKYMVKTPLKMIQKCAFVEKNIQGIVNTTLEKKLHKVCVAQDVGCKVNFHEQVRDEALIRKKQSHPRRDT